MYQYIPPATSFVNVDKFKLLKAEMELEQSKEALCKTGFL